MLSDEQKNNILTYLKSNFKLPAFGFVAGQAVASLIYRELGIDIPFFINDVDVFQQNNNKSVSRACEAKSILSKLNGSSFQVII